MLINSLNSVTVHVYKTHIGFKKKNTENPISLPSGSNKFSGGEKAGVIGGVVVALVSVVAALKNKKVVNGFNKIFSSNKNVIQDASFYKGVDLRNMAKEAFLENFIKPLKLSTEKDIKYPSNGFVVYGPESKAKNDFFEWMVDELKKTGVEILDPKPGANPKFDDVQATVRVFFDGANSEMAKERFQKDKKFRALVIRGLDEIGQPQKNLNKTPLKHPDDVLLNDNPDTNYSAEHYGLMLFYKVKDLSKLHPATVRTGRTDYKMSIMPYADEPVKIWQNYIDEIRRSTDASFTVRAIEMTKEIFSKRPKEEMKAILPHLEYQVPYKYLGLDAPLKKWKNWVEYMGERKGVDFNKRVNDFLKAISIIMKKEAYNEEARKVVKNDEKFKSILDFMTKKILEKDSNSSEVWNSLSQKAIEGTLNFT